MRKNEQDLLADLPWKMGEQEDAAEEEAIN